MSVYMCGCWLETPESWHEGEPILKMSVPEYNAFQALLTLEQE